MGCCGCVGTHERPNRVQAGNKQRGACGRGYRKDPALKSGHSEYEIQGPFRGARGGLGQDGTPPQGFGETLSKASAPQNQAHSTPVAGGLITLCRRCRGVERNLGNEISKFFIEK